MNYTSILKHIADKNNTSPEKVEAEMKTALKAAGYDIDPAVFISLAAEYAKKTIYRN